MENLLDKNAMRMRRAQIFQRAYSLAVFGSSAPFALGAFNVIENGLPSKAGYLVFAFGAVTLLAGPASLFFAMRRQRMSQGITAVLGMFAWLVVVVAFLLMRFQSALEAEIGFDSTDQIQSLLRWLFEPAMVSSCVVSVISAVVSQIEVSRKQVQRLGCDESITQIGNEPVES